MTTPPAAAKARSALQALRERRGGVSAEMKAWLKDQQDVRKSPAGGPGGGRAARCRTWPGSAASRPAPVLWHLMAMRRYGELAEAGERDRYVLYALKEGLKR